MILFFSMIGTVDFAVQYSCTGTSRFYVLFNLHKVQPSPPPTKKIYNLHIFPHAIFHWVANTSHASSFTPSKQVTQHTSIIDISVQYIYWCLHSITLWKVLCESWITGHQRDWSRPTGGLTLHLRCIRRRAMILFSDFFILYCLLYLILSLYSYTILSWGLPSDSDALPEIITLTTPPPPVLRSWYWNYCGVTSHEESTVRSADCGG